MTRITQERMEKALHYLAATDDQVGPAKARVKRAERKIKTAEKIAYSLSKGATVKDREAAAAQTQGYLDAEIEEYEAIKELGTLMAKRETEQTLIEAWRSINASQRRS